MENGYKKIYALDFLLNERALEECWDIMSILIAFETIDES